MYSLSDGSVIFESKRLHSNYIMQILSTTAGKRMITCGKDRKIKVWDQLKQQLISNLLFHEGIVESIVLTRDDKTLFSGGQDQKIGVWCMKTYTLLTHLNCQSKIRTLRISNSGEFLLSESIKDFANLRSL